MSDPAKLDLVWYQQNPSVLPEPRIRIQRTTPSPDAPAPEAPEVPVEYALSPCIDPRCGCSTLQLIQLPETSPTEPQPKTSAENVWLDLETRSLSKETDSTARPDLDRLGGILREHLTDAQCEELFRWHADRKLETIYRAPSDGIDIQDLPDASNGELVGFVEIFPHGLDFRFTFEGETWAVDDQYCVQRQCSCTEATLTFLKLAGHSVPGSRTLGCGPILGYDYASRKTKRVGIPQMQGVLRTDLLEAVQAAHPKLDTFLRLRHEILKILYLRDELARIQAYLKTLPSLVRPKVGRNDPCPCGSGRKYKQCCLNKPTP